MTEQAGVTSRRSRFLPVRLDPKPLLVNDAATSWPREHAPASSRRLTYVAVAAASMVA
jgi:hypothetical protein